VLANQSCLPCFGAKKGIETLNGATRTKAVQPHAKFAQFRGLPLAHQLLCLCVMPVLSSSSLCAARVAALHLCLAGFVPAAQADGLGMHLLAHAEVPEIEIHSTFGSTRPASTC
jgi:hypothetical protein